MKTLDAARSTLSEFLPSDHTRLNDLLKHGASIPAKHHRFLADMQGKRRRYRRPMLTSAQRKYLLNLHQALCHQGIVEALAS